MCRRAILCADRGRSDIKPNNAASPAGSVPVIATIKSVDSLNELHQLAEKLAGTGMTVTRVLPLSEAITGSCPADEIAALNSQVSEVVERELSARLS